MSNLAPQNAEDAMTYTRKIMGAKMLTREQHDALWAEFEELTPKDPRYAEMDDDEKRDERVRSRQNLTPRAEAIRWQILEAHMRMCVKAAKNHSGYGVSVRDMVGEAQIGMMKAFDRFDAERGLMFATYASHWINAEVKSFVLSNYSSVKIGTTYFEKSMFFAYSRLHKEARIKKPEAGGEELRETVLDLWMDEQKYTPAQKRKEGPQLLEKLNALREKMRSANLSLNFTLAADDTRELQDVIPSKDPSAEQLLIEQSELDFGRNMLAAAKDHFLAANKEREWDILMRRRMAEDPETLEDLSPVYGVSRERIRQIEMRAFQRLQTFAQKYKADREINLPPPAKPKSAPRTPPAKTGNDNTQNGGAPVFAARQNTPKAKPAPPARAERPIPAKFEPENIGARKLKAVWDAHVSQRGQNKAIKGRDWQWYEQSKFNGRRMPALAAEAGISYQSVHRNVKSVGEKLSDLFKGRAIDDVANEAAAWNTVISTPELVAELKSRFMALKFLKDKESMERGWQYYAMVHIDTPNITRAEVARQFGLDHSAISVKLQKVGPVIEELGKQLAAEVMHNHLEFAQGDLPESAASTAEPPAENEQDLPREANNYLQIVRDRFLATGVFRGRENMLRNWKIYKAARNEDAPMDENEIADRYNLSRLRVKQIVTKMDDVVEDILDELLDDIDAEIERREASNDADYGAEDLTKTYG